MRRYLNSDVYRVSASTGSSGWEIAAPNELATAEFGTRVDVPVHARRTGSGPKVGTVRLTATSESDPSRTSTAVCTVIDR